MTEPRRWPHGMVRGSVGETCWTYDTVDLPVQLETGRYLYFDWLHTPECVAAHLDAERKYIILTGMWMQFGDARLAPEVRFVPQQQPRIWTTVVESIAGVGLVHIRSREGQVPADIAVFPSFPGERRFYVTHAVGCLVKKNFMPGWESRRMLFDAELEVPAPVTLPFPLSLKLAVCWHEPPRFTPGGKHA